MKSHTCNLIAPRRMSLIPGGTNWKFGYAQTMNIQLLRRILQSIGLSFLHWHSYVTLRMAEQAQLGLSRSLEPAHGGNIWKVMQGGFMPMLLTTVWPLHRNLIGVSEAAPWSQNLPPEIST